MDKDYYYYYYYYYYALFFAPIYLKLYAQLGQLDLSQVNGSEPAQSSSIKRKTLMTLLTSVLLLYNMCL